MEEEKLISYIKNIHRNNLPSGAWILKTRQNLLFHMRQNSSAKEEHVFSLFGIFNMAPRNLALASFTLLFLAVIGAGSALGMRALPSSPFYPIKLIMEQAKGTIAFTEEQKADYGLARARERIQELTVLSREIGARNSGLNQTALITQTLERYTEAIGSSARSVKQLKADGKGDIARRAAEKLDETAQAYTVLLSRFDTASSSLAIFTDAKTVSEEAKSTAAEILGEDEEVVAATDTPSSSPESSPSFSEEPVPSGASPLASPSPSASPEKQSVVSEPSILPNTIAE